MSDSTLRNQTREQIAIGVSVVAKCQPCLQYHLKEARRFGVTDKEIEFVIKLARQIRSMSEQKMDEFVVESLGSENSTTAAAAEAQGCCPPAEESKKEKKEKEAGGCC